MKKQYTLKLLCLLVLSIGAFSSLIAQRQLSEMSEISLLSCEPGPDVYARFGHTGIRVNDPLTNFDVTFHYGIFSFDTPFFIAKFVKGATDYEIGYAPTEYFMQEYINRNSSVHEQVLNLSQSEKQALFDALFTNYLPENRLYRYNFIYDNCATRPYHIINNNSVYTIHYEFIDSMTTFRDIIESYVGYNNWLRFGIDLVIGSEADSYINEEETLSFPLYLKGVYDKAWIDKGSDSIPLIKETNMLYVSTPHTIIEDEPFSPTWVMTLLLVVGVLLTFIEYKKRRYFAWFDALLFGVAGFFGCVIFFLMFISVHPLVHYNFNLLWLNPLQLLFAFALIVKRWRPILRYYQYVNLLCIVIAIVVYVAQWQLMNSAFFPIMILMLIRSLNYINRSTPIVKRVQE